MPLTLPQKKIPMVLLGCRNTKYSAKLLKTTLPEILYWLVHRNIACPEQVGYNHLIHAGIITLSILGSCYKLKENIVQIC